MSRNAEAHMLGDCWSPSCPYCEAEEAREEVAAWDEDRDAARHSFESHKDGSGCAIYEDLNTTCVVTIEWGAS